MTPAETIALCDEVLNTSGENGPKNFVESVKFGKMHAAAAPALAAAVRRLSEENERMRKAFIPSLIRAYTLGEHAGHHSTVEGGFVPVHDSDAPTYHEETIKEALADGSFPEAQAALASLTQPESGD